MLMRKMSRFWKSLMLGLASATVVACSSDEYQMDVPVAPEDAQPVISLKIASPRAGSYVVEGGARATVHTTDEWTVNTLNVYIFKKGDGDVYTFYSKTSFPTNGNEHLLTSSGDATYTCSLKIDNALLQATVQILLLANEDGTVNCEQGVTTLADFKATLAQATVVADANADDLVDYTAAETDYGFAMSAQAMDAQSETELTLTTAGVDVTASLVRNVARIDIQNNTPNLAITGVRMHNTVSQSYLFAQDPIAAPDGASTITLLPMQSYMDEGSFTALTYQTGDGADNEYESMLYLYEQPAAVSDETCPYVSIDYTLTFEDRDGNEVQGAHTIKVYFKDGATYLPVKRNNLYKIVLGDGTEVNGKTNLATKVMVWDDSENAFELLF